MAEFRLKNENGLFYHPSPRAVMTMDAAAYINAVVIPDIKDPKFKEQAIEAMAAVEALPLMDAFSYYGAMDSQYDPSIAKNRGPQYGICPCRAWLDLGIAKSNSPSSLYPAGSPQEAGWEAARAVQKALPTLNQLRRSAGLDPISESDFSALATLKKKAASVVFEKVDADRELAQSQSCALFLFHGDNPGGFLDSKGRSGPLSRARMFESPAAAARTARSHGFSNWKAVSVSMTVSGLHDLVGDSSNDQLAGAVARLEAEALSQALDSAGIERLKAKLAELSARLGADEPKAEGEAPARPKSRL